MFLRTWAFLAIAVVAVMLPLGNSQGYTSGTVAYTPTYGQAYSVASGYGTCGSLKVVDILDQIYCHHAYYTRFTSTDLAALKVVMYDLGLVAKFAHIQSVLDYTEQTIYMLEDLKEDIYKSYDSSQLGQYYQGAGYEYTDIADFLTNMTDSLQSFENIRQGYRAKYGMILWGKFIPDSYSNKYKRATRGSVNPSSSSSSSSASARRSRDADASEYTHVGDSTCAYLPASFCAANSLLVKNLLYRVLKAVKSISDGLTILYDYIKNHDCGENDDGKGKYALLVVADSFGSLLCAADVLLEAAKYEYAIYTAMAGATAYSNAGLYARAAGGSGVSSSPYVGASPYQRYPYVPMGGLRYQRATPAVVKTVVVTPGNGANATNPAARGRVVAG